MNAIKCSMVITSETNTISGLSQFIGKSVDVILMENPGVLRSGGITVPFQDDVITTLCIKKYCTPCSLDSHFNINAATITGPVHKHPFYH